MSKKNLVSTALIMLPFLSLFNIAVFAAPTHHLTVMTWNIHGGNPGDYHGSNCKSSENPNKPVPLSRMEPFDKEIQDYNRAHPGLEIQVIAIQEIHRDEAFYLATLLSKNPRHVKYIAKFFRTKRCYCSDLKGDYDYGNAIIASLIPTSVKTFAIAPKHTTPSCDTFEYTRLGALTVQVPGGPAVRIYTNHSAGDPLGKKTGNEKILAMTQLDEINRVIMQLDTVALTKPRILMGDFNFDPFISPDFYNKWKGLNYRDAWREANTNPLAKGNTAPTDLNPFAHPALVRYDYIFLRSSSSSVTKPVAKEHIQVNYLPYQSREKQSISDHYPVIADLFF
jgi:endonuclease/exonuclease/phosphatase family metal-dependent hydrolase